jgi:heptosyltransferase-2
MPRLLVILPSWIGDAVMATPALALIRERMKGSFIGALARPGVVELMEGELDSPADGSRLLDEIHIEQISGMMGPKRAAAKLRARRYDAAVLFTNSFSTALAARMAFIPERIGYDRDGRGLLLTKRLKPEKRASGDWAVVPAVEYYWRLARAVTEGEDPGPEALPPDARMRLPMSESQRSAGEAVLERAGVAGSDFAILNPGGNNSAKRWPTDRFARVAEHLAQAHGLRVLVSGAPNESGLCDDIVQGADCDPNPVSIAGMEGMSIGALKGVIARARMMVSCDTGPRHIAAALGVPVVSLFGPTDHRWTTIPAPAGETVVVADPTLPETEVANDHPERCAIERITVERVLEAADGLLDTRTD